MGRDFLYGLESRHAQSRSYLAIYSCFIDFAAFRYLRTDFRRVVFRGWSLALAGYRDRGRAGRLELAPLSVAQKLCRSPLFRLTGTDTVARRLKPPRGCRLPAVRQPPPSRHAPVRPGRSYR